MNIIQSMIHEKLGEVRIIKSEDGNPMNTLFCAVDVCNVLDYKNPRDIIIKHCRCVSHRDIPHPQNLNKSISVNFITLSDVFRIINRSNKPEAIEFQDWINDDLLPTLYQFGNYTIQEHIPNPEFTNPMFNPQNVGIEANDYNKYDLTTTSSDSLGNVLEIDNRPMVYNMGIMLNQYMEPLFDIMNNLTQRLDNIQSQVNSIQTNTEEIKQMIIPAIIVNK